MGPAEAGIGRHPPVDSDRRKVRRKSSRPCRPIRRRRARRDAIRRANGRSDRCSAARSSRLAWRKSTSSGSGRRTDRATACGPRSATSRRRTSASTSSRKRCAGGQQVVTLHRTGAGQQAGQGAVHIKHAHRLEDVRAPRTPRPSSMPASRATARRASRAPPRRRPSATPPPAGRPGLRPRRRSSEGAEREVGVEDRVERRPVLRPLHHGGGHGHPRIRLRGSRSQVPAWRPTYPPRRSSSNAPCRLADEASPSQGAVPGQAEDAVECADVALPDVVLRQPWTSGVAGRP